MTDIGKINELIIEAYKSYSIYQQIYDKPPLIEELSEFDLLPILNIFDVPKYINHSAMDITQCAGTLPIDLTNFYSPLFPALITEEEYGIAKKYFIDLLNIAGISSFDEILILVEAERAYICFDLANLLLEYKILPLIKFITRKTINPIKEDIKKTGIKCIFDLSSNHFAHELSSETVDKIILVNGIPPNSGSEKYSTLYYVDKCGYIGVKNQTNNYFYYDKDKYFLELAPNNQIIITCLFRKLLPALRFGTFDKGSIVNGNLIIDSFAE